MKCLTAKPHFFIYFCQHFFHDTIVNILQSTIQALHVFHPFQGRVVFSFIFFPLLILLCNASSSICYPDPSGRSRKCLPSQQVPTLSPALEAIRVADGRLITWHIASLRRIGSVQIRATKNKVKEQHIVARLRGYFRVLLELWVSVNIHT